MAASITSMTVALKVQGGTSVADACVDAATPIEAAAIALHQFRRQGGRVFERAAFVDVATTPGEPVRFSISEVIAWLKRPEQAALVQRFQAV